MMWRQLKRTFLLQDVSWQKYTAVMKNVLVCEKRNITFCLLNGKKSYASGLCRNYEILGLRSNQTTTFLNPSKRCSSVAYVDYPHHKEENKDALKINIPEPEFDFKYLCDPQNASAIRKNIENRKGIGDIEKVQSLWNELYQDASTDTNNEGSQNQNNKAALKAMLISEAAKIPNRTHPEAPIGDETQNKIVETVGQKQEFDFEPKSTVDLGENLGMLRTKNLGYSTGHRSYYFIDGFARLERALIKYTLDNLLQEGFQLMSVPDLVPPQIVEGCGFQTTGDRTQVYRLNARHGNLCLAGTGEIPLSGYFMNKVLDADELPKKVCTVSRCYRAEAGHTHTEDIYRVHQFTKVEMFVIASADNNCILEELVTLQKKLFSQLGLHFRVLDMASHELGAPAYRKYDIEAWMPVPQMWGEISSSSNCTDFQSRRLNIKYCEQNGHLKHVHTLNGTGCAVPRMIISIVENNQNKDGSIRVPDVLQPYMGGITQLVKPKKPVKMEWIKYTKDYIKKIEDIKKKKTI